MTVGIIDYTMHQEFDYPVANRRMGALLSSSNRMSAADYAVRFEKNILVYFFAIYLRLFLHRFTAIEI